MSAWSLVYDDWDPGRQPLREALCTLGNGRFATRGAFEEAEAGGPHYPGTYVAGGYNRLRTRIEGRDVENEDLVNWPNWLCLTFRPQGGEWLTSASCDVVSLRQELHLDRGLLERRVLFRDREGRETSLHSRRLVHMADPHLAALHWSLTPENWSGEIEIRSAIDGRVRNSGVERYRALRGDHLEMLGSGRSGEDAIYLRVRTRQSRLRVTMAMRTRVRAADRPDRSAAPAREGGSVPGARTVTEEAVDHVAQVVTLECEQGRPLEVDKSMVLFTSRDRAISEETDAACIAIGRAGAFDDHLETHVRAWASLWRTADIEIEGPAEHQLALRLHVFHLLQTVGPNSRDLDAGVPARGLHGEAYRGHIFWDELFIFPFLNQSLPELTRTLLLYRYRRLPAARRNARRAGFRGALYPWQSGSDGREESQTVHLNPRSGRWNPDDTHLQRHINSAIAYNVWNYYRCTGDREFLVSAGAEMILEIARFWSSAVVYDVKRERYVLRGVVGPDEYHTALPGRDSPGLDNNAYTNVTAAWALRCAAGLHRHLDDETNLRLRARLSLTDGERDHWDDVSRRLFVPFLEGGIISQFEGYDRLQEFDWQGYRTRYDDIQRLDRILAAEDDSPNRYKASKQADVLMLFYLFSKEELQDLLEHMGYRFARASIPRIVRYYADRTSHGSTLSRLVHSWVIARSDRAGSWNLFKEALRSDLEDIQGGTTHEGIHLGAMAGTTDLVQRCYVGVELDDEALRLNPTLPDELDRVRFRVRYRGHWIRLEATQRELRVEFERGAPHRVAVSFRGDLHEMGQGESRTFRLASGTS